MKINDVYRIEKSVIENLKEILEIHKMNPNQFFQICLVKLWLKRHDNIKIEKDCERVPYTHVYEKDSPESRPNEISRAMLAMKFEALRVHFPNASDNDLLNTALHYEIMSWENK